jgi:CHAD domain-containing protein
MKPIAQFWDSDREMMIDQIMTEPRLHEDLIGTLKMQAQPVTADDTMTEAGRKIMLDELIDMLKHEGGSRSGDDIEDVHDMRVASRRIRSALRLLADYYKPKATRVYNRKLRRVARALGGVRDLDVMIEAFNTYVNTALSGEALEEAQPHIAAIVEALDDDRRLARRELVHTLDRGEYKRFVAEFSTFLTTEGAGAKTLTDEVTPVRVRHVLPTLIYSHLGAVRAFDPVIAEAIASGDQTTLHALRIEFKRLRYAVSMFSEVLGSQAANFIDELKAIQDHLGALQDGHTAAARLDAYADMLPDEAAALLRRYIEHLHTSSDAQRADFAEVWKRFNSKTVQKMLASAVAAL